MKPETEEWIEEAEVDFEMARRAAWPPLIAKGLCFHAHQCIEKYLKAILEEANQPIPRTHDLGSLLVLIAGLPPDLTPYATDISAISPYAVVMRYPGGVSPWDDIGAEARLAEEVMRAVRLRIRAEFGLQGGGGE